MSASSETSSAARIPILLQNFARSCCDCEHHFAPLQIQNISGIEEHKDTVVDVAIKNVSDKVYSGDERKRQSVEMKFGDYITYYTAKYTNNNHWLCSVSDLEFYLCQCPMFVDEETIEKGVSMKTSLPKLMQHFQIPDLLEREKVSQINFWMAAAPSQTNIHYDAYQNILVVLSGKKVVTLYPPSEYAKLHPYPIYSESSNHSQVKSHTTQSSMHSTFEKADKMVLSVGAGSAVFIPEGWWHQVRSDSFTIAINYWYNGLRQQLLDNPLAQAYYSRILAQELLKKECDEYISRIRQKPDRSIGAGEVVARIIEVSLHTSREGHLIPLESVMLYEVLLNLARNHIILWKDLLSCASAELVAVLLHEWESNEMFDSEFYAVIFSPWGSEDEKAMIQADMMRKRDNFRQKVWYQLAKPLFG